MKLGRFIVSALLCFGASALCLNYTLNWPPAGDDLQFFDALRIAQTGFRSWLHLLVTAQNGDHPVGLQMLVVTGLWSMTGANYTLIVCVSYAVLTATVLLLLWATIDEACGLVAALLLPIAAFHPIQMNHLLWPYEMCWFLITFFTAFNAVAIERFRYPALWASIGCFLATYSSAHGKMLWLVAAAHLFAIRRALLIPILFVLTFAYLALTAPYYVDVLSDPVKLVPYAFKLFGSIFGTRNDLWLYLLSTALIASVGLLFFTSRSSPAVRIAASLIFATVLFVGVFSAGRGVYGLPWALSRFHAAPLLIPAALGLVILASKAFSERRAVLGSAGALLALGSAIASLPYALERSRENSAAVDRSRQQVCSGDRSEQLKERFGTNNINVILRNADALMALCPST